MIDQDDPALPGPSADPAVWCRARGHPLVTQNPWLRHSYCRCGAVVVAGLLPLDMTAKHWVLHDHPVGAPCRCYLRP